MNVLLVEDNLGDARLLRETLVDASAADFTLTHVLTLAEAQKCLTNQVFELILSDLSLPDSQGLQTFQHLHEFSPEVPIIVLTGTNDEAQAVKAVKTGAQDYLVKGQVDGPLLVRAMRYAVERHRMQLSLRSLSLIDELTGIYNRRGFLTLAEQQLKFASRAKNAMVVLFADLDCMKEINDTYGHSAGDLALMKTAEILRETLRESDIMARMGGDEFVVLALEKDTTSAEMLVARLQERIAIFNASETLSYPLSLSVGAVRFDPEQPCSLCDLLGRADALMYDEKRHKKQDRTRAEALPTP